LMRNTMGSTSRAQSRDGRETTRIVRCDIIFNPELSHGVHSQKFLQ
jgi:uncharacterized C2H2 Zn-finger protein